MKSKNAYTPTCLGKARLFRYTNAEVSSHAGGKCLISIQPILDAPSFEEIYMRYHPCIFAFIMKRVKNYHDAEDICSSVFSYFFEWYPKYDPAKGTPKTILFRIAHCRILNYFRDSEKREKLQDLQGAIMPQLDDTDILSAIERKELLDELTDSIAGLHPREQRILKMYYFEGLTSIEIANFLGITKGNVRVILSRCRKKLAEQFKCSLL